VISLAQWRKTKTYPGLHPVIDSSITYLKKALERDPILQSAPLLRVVLDSRNKTLTIDNEFWMWVTLIDNSEYSRLLLFLRSTPVPGYGEKMANCMASFQVLSTIIVVCPPETSILQYSRHPNLYS
jgi:hypothetical protein